MFVRIAALTALIFIAAPVFAADPPAKMGMAQAVPQAQEVTDGNVFLADATGKYAHDPVCGMTIKVDEKTVKAEHDGKRYYFCSAKCSEVFSSDPVKGMAKMAMPANVIAMKDDQMLAKCAVSGERVAVNERTPHQVYKGHDYYFCCNKCPVKFSANPEKYALAAPAAEKAEEKAMEHKGHDDHSGH